ncbi:MAG TPA: PAS domain S-box protein [Lacunisphaera sp.]|nr:PAS domain S-box protein [Lacunisphaera sp.]
MPDPVRPDLTDQLQARLSEAGRELARTEAALRQSEASRRESQDFFAKSFQTTPALMIIARLADGHILEANAGFEAASGFTRGEAIGRNTLELGLWPNQAARDAFLESLRRDGRVRDFEGVFRNKHGELRHLLLNADLFEMNGTTCMLTVGLDITERQRRERVQSATYQISHAVLAGGDLPALFGELHRIIAGLMPARNFYVALLSPDGRQISFPYFEDETIPPPPTRAVGYGLTEFVLHTGKPLLTTADELTVLLRENSRYAPVGMPAALWLGAPLMIAGRAIGVIAVQDYRNPRAYGEEEKRLLLFVADQAAAAVHRRQSEEALARAEQQYRGIFEHALEGLYQSLPDGTFLRANPALARMLGYDSPTELLAAVNDIGGQIYAQPGRRAEFMRLIAGKDEVTDFESEILRRDGSRIWISESVRVLRGPDGHPALFEGVAIDITARREAARALQEAKEAADAANRAKSQFLASMSHELRTPLNGILGYTQILQRDAALTDKQRDGLGIIHQSAEHLLAVINDVLDLARIEARKLELHPADFDLPEFLHAVEAFFLPRAREKNLLFETAFAADLPRVVTGDAQRLRQVAFNLLSNAVKFTPRGGVVFSVEKAGERIRFSVSDSGPGIAPEDQLRLFEPFAQIGDHHLHAEGTGLGLNVSRGIVEQMGGRLQIESRAGWGSRFWFEVPLPASLRARPAPPTAPRRITGYAGPRLRVLVADDHPANRRLLVDLLQPLGFEVATADDGRAAVEQAVAQRPDLVLLDLRMPRLDGFAAARAIRAAFPAGAPRLVGVSASAFEPDRQACLDAGCAEFLAKPFREEQLFAVLERQLGLRWLQAEPPAGETSSPFPAIVDAPSPADAEALHELACKGDVIGVRAYAQKMAARDARLAPFAQGVTDLAARFKMKAIRQFVARYRAGDRSHS